MKAEKRGQETKTNNLTENFSQLRHALNECCWFIITKNLHLREEMSCVSL